MIYIIYILLSTSFINATEVQAQKPNPQVLIGTWKLDMTPHNPDDNNFAMMHIESTKDNRLTGMFYREGVKLESGSLNSQTGTLYGALVSRDNSGSYNSTFYLKDGKLYGTTHAIDRKFLAVWTATKNK